MARRALAAKRHGEYAWPRVAGASGGTNRRTARPAWSAPAPRPQRPSRFQLLTSARFAGIVEVDFPNPRKGRSRQRWISPRCAVAVDGACASVRLPARDRGLLSARTTLGRAAEGTRDMTDCTVQRAEALLRSLVGITAAEVRVSPSGRLELVRVATACPLSNGQVVQNVRSALFVGLGLRLDPAQVELIDPKTWVAAAAPAVESAAGEGGTDAAPPTPSDPPVANGNGNGGNGRAHGPSGNGGTTSPAAAAVTNGSAAGPATVQNGHGAPQATPAPAGYQARIVGGEIGLVGRPVNGGAQATARLASAAAGQLPARAPANGNGAKAVSAVPGPAAGRSRGLEIEAVELLRLAGRLRCRVSLTAGSSRYAAVADAAEDTVPEYQLAARVTCDTIRAAQLSNAHFDGAVVTHVAGRTHVVVALSEWKAGNEHVSLTGSAVVTDRLEHAAAAAVLQALHGT